MDVYSTAIYWIGATLIFIYALDRFNTPPTNRSSTTALRYYAAAMVYVFLFEATFAVLVNYPGALNAIRGYAGALPALPAEDADPEAITIGVSLLLSVLVPKTPFLKRLDAGLRRFLQTYAAIPTEAKRFAAAIREAEFAPDESLCRELDEVYGAKGLPVAAAPGDGRDAVTDWHRLSAIMLQLGRWPQMGRFSQFLNDRKGQFDRLQSRYERNLDVARAYFSVRAASSSSRDADDPLRLASDNFCRGFEQEIEDTLKEASELVSHALLTCCWAPNGRGEQLNAMGLQPARERRAGISADEGVILFGMLVGVFLLFAAIATPERFEEAAPRFAMVAAVYTVAVFCAVLPKQRWAPFRRLPGQRPPALAYVLSGVAAMAGALTVSVAFRMLSGLSDQPPLAALMAAWADFRANSYPWLAMSFVATVATAALIDAEALRRVGDGSRRRIVEAAIMAALIGVTSVVVWIWLSGVRAGASVPPMSRVVMVSAAIGAIIGGFVPHWYRNGGARLAETVAVPGRRASG